MHIYCCRQTAYKGKSQSLCKAIKFTFIWAFCAIGGPSQSEEVISVRYGLAVEGSKHGCCCFLRSKLDEAVTLAELRQAIPDHLHAY